MHVITYRCRKPTFIYPLIYFPQFMWEKCLCMWSFHTITIVWASYPIRKIAGCACAGNAGNIFPATDFKGNRLLASRHASRHARHARAVMHVGIANPRWWGKRSRQSRRMRNPQFYVSGKRPIGCSHSSIACLKCGLFYNVIEFRAWVND